MMKAHRPAEEALVNLALIQYYSQIVEISADYSSTVVCCTKSSSTPYVPQLYQVECTTLDKSYNLTQPNMLHKGRRQSTHLAILKHGRHSQY